MTLNHPELQSRLAAEYVLGTLNGGARRRFAEYLRHHRALREEVAKWEAHFTPLAEAVPPITPPDRVWKNIESRISASPVLAGAFRQNLAKIEPRGGLGITFWRNLGLAASGLAVTLLVTLFTGNVWQTTHDPMMTAVLEDQGVARMVIEQPQSGMLMVKMVKPWKAAKDNSLQLWVIPKDGAPRSIGIINQDGSTQIAMKEMDAMLNNGLEFAVSKEPMGGSPTGQPTGKIICKGVIAKMPPKQKDKSQI